MSIKIFDGQLSDCGSSSKPNATMKSPHSTIAKAGKAERDCESAGSLHNYTSCLLRTPELLVNDKKLNDPWNQNEESN
jgi:hypothetical protein